MKRQVVLIIIIFTLLSFNSNAGFFDDLVESVSDFFQSSPLATILPTNDLDCEYKISEYYQEEGVVLYREGKREKFGEPLIFSNFQSGTGSISSPCVVSFRITNPNDFEVLLDIEYFVRVKQSFRQPQNIRYYESWNILANGFISLKSTNTNKKTCSIIEDNINYVITSPERAVPVKEMITKSREVCKECNGKQCLNDGQKCNINSECGGNYCIRNICTNSMQCYNKDCNCAEGEIQCSDNTGCGVKSTLSNGATPACNKMECKTSYVNEEGRCDWTPETKKIFKIIFYSGIGLVSLIFVLIGMNFYMKSRKELINKKLELITKNQTTQNHTLDEIKNLKSEEIRLKKLKKKNKEKLAQLDSVTQKIITKTKQVEKITDTQKKAVNDLISGYKYTKGWNLVLDNGYLRFAKKRNSNEIGEFLHRYIWFKKTGSWPKKGYEIHHINGNKLDNRIENLQEISIEKHKKLHGG